MPKKECTKYPKPCKNATCNIGFVLTLPYTDCPRRQVQAFSYSPYPFSFVVENLVKLYYVYNQSRDIADTHHKE